MPAIAGRVAQTVAANRIGTAAERFFHADSCGYRPGRGAHDALAVARERCWKFGWVIESGIRAFSGGVPHDLVVRAVEGLRLPAWVLRYVKRWLAAPVIMGDGEARARDQGTPQGSAASPVIANLFLHWAFDAWTGREFPDCPFERYAGDGLIHCNSQARARQVLAALAQRMTEAGLDLHPGKTRIIYCKDGKRNAPWDGPVSSGFLGYAFRPRDTMGKNGRFTGSGLAASGKAVKKMNQAVSGWRLHRLTGLTWEQLAGWIGPVIRGRWPATAGSATRCWTRCSPRSTTTSRNGSGANTGDYGLSRP